MQYSGFIFATGLALAIGQAAGATAVSGYSAGLGFAPSGLQVIQAQYVDPYEARRREEALRLSRNDRRAIQGGLQTLGYNPGPADGYFGNRTRNAIASWQRDMGDQVSGYLTRQQFRDINEATRRTQPGGGSTSPDIASDLNFWMQTGANAGNIEGLQRYLQRYPNGFYADNARAQLQTHDRRGSSEERALWQQVRSADNPRAYRLYLEQFPQGHYADAARTRLRELDPPKPKKDVQPDHLVAWSEARQQNTIAGYERFLRDYPNSRHAPDARQQLRELRRDTVSENDMRAWRRAQTQDSFSGYMAYLDRFPQGHFARDARTRLTELRKSPKKDARPVDEVAWYQAQQKGSMDSFKQFLLDYPNSRYAQLARNNIKRLSK